MKITKASRSLALQRTNACCAPVQYREDKHLCTHRLISEDNSSTIFTDHWVYAIETGESKHAALRCAVLCCAVLCRAVLRCSAAIPRRLHACTESPCTDVPNPPLWKLTMGAARVAEAMWPGLRSSLV